MKRCILFLSIMLCSCTWVWGFQDVPAEHWSYPYVSQVAEENFIQGYEDGSFRPDSPMSLQEFAVILSTSYYGTSLEMISQTEFSQWWEPYVYTLHLRDALRYTTIDLAIQQSSQEGYRFRGWEDYITQPLTRYDAAAILSNVIVDRFYPRLSQGEAGIMLQHLFPSSDISSQYEVPVAMVIQYNLMSTQGNGDFQGEDSITRGQAAVILCALLNQEKLSLETREGAKARLESGAYQQNTQDITGNLWVENYVFARVNELRVALNLQPVVHESSLLSYAYQRAQESAIRWAHTRPDGSSWNTVISPLDTENRLTGENLTMGSGFYPYEYPDMIFKSWINSPSHYANMINPQHQRLGLAVSVTEAGAYYAAQIFSVAAS